MALPVRAMFWRSLTLEASWHAERMQGLGFLYALLPQLRRHEDVGQALTRHAGYFNTNTASVGAILGMVARLESEGRGDEARRLRDHLAAPLSGQADLFLWGVLRPLALSMALIGILAAQPFVGMILGVLLFNLPLWQLRWRGLEAGLEEGANLVRRLEIVRPSRAWTHRLRQVCAFLAGGLLLWGVIQGWKVGPGAAFHVSAAALVGYYAHRREVSPGITFLILVVLSAAVQRLAVFAIWLQ